MPPVGVRPGWALMAAVAMMATLASCSDDTATRSSGPDPEDTDLTADRCLVRLHGRSDTGADPVEHSDHVELSPTGNGRAGEGHQWLYDNVDHQSQATDRVEAWIDRVGCTDVVLYGFSNGAAFAGWLYCSGESFKGRLRGVVVDDPVTDEAVEGCEPPDGVPVALYWTGALTEAQAGTACDDIGFTCYGDLILGTDAYAEALGATPQPSPHDSHLPYRDAPELLEWLLDPSA